MIVLRKYAVSTMKIWSRCKIVRPPDVKNYNLATFNSVYNPYQCYYEQCMRKLHTRPALNWTAVSTIIKSHQQVLGNLNNELTPL